MAAVVPCDGAGTASHALDLTQLPDGGAAQTVGTWNFRFWYRDPSGGQNGWNLSDAVAVTLYL